jgi:hypothetical protein
MKIVYLINGLNGGGAAFPMVQVLGLMQELGQEVQVFALLPQDGKAAPRLAQAGIPWEVLGDHPWSVLGPAMRLVRRLRDDRPDLLWTSLTRGTLYGQLAGRLLGIPVVSWQHSDYLKPANLAILRRTRRLSSRWIADSEAVAQFTRTRLGVPADRLDIWPPFVADPQLPVATAWPGSGPFRSAASARTTASSTPCCCAFARARELDAASAARSSFTAGDGEERAASIAGRGTGPRPGARSGIRLAARRVLRPARLCPDLPEGRPCIAAHEAMLAGLPVVSTRVGELARSVSPAKPVALRRRRRRGAGAGDARAGTRSGARATLARPRGPRFSSAIRTSAFAASASACCRRLRAWWRTTGDRRGRPLGIFAPLTMAALVGPTAARRTGDARAHPH